MNKEYKLKLVKATMLLYSLYKMGHFSLLTTNELDIFYTTMLSTVKLSIHLDFSQECLIKKILVLPFTGEIY